jgi:AcrR family transcriptional regulator
MSAKDASKTRAKVLKTAGRLFYSRGIRPVSMDEIAEAAGVTKRTLYYHFASKDDLVVAYLEDRDCTARAALDTAVRRRGDSPLEQLLGVFDELEVAFRSTRFRGCPFMNAAAELSDVDHPARPIAIRHKEELRAWLEGLASNLGVSDPRGLSEQLLLLLDGAIANWLVRGDPEAARHARQAATVLLTAAGARVCDRACDGAHDARALDRAVVGP